MWRIAADLVVLGPIDQKQGSVDNHAMSETKILLADDHEVVRSGINNALQVIPDIVIVGEVGSGPELMAALESLVVDCLLIDVAMPDFQPIRDIRQIRTRFPTMKILVVSAHDDDVYVQGLLAAGVDGYHMKDQPLNDLRLAVQRVLEGQRWISSRLVDKLIAPSPQRPTTLPQLTGRQKDILSHLQQGLDNQTIARQMNLSVKTIENHLTRLYRQLNVQSRLEAANFVMNNPEILGQIPHQSPSLHQPVHLPERTPPTTSEMRSPITLLLVDDNPRYRSQLRRMVDKIGSAAVIVEASTIAEAQRQTELSRPQLAFVDVVLGDESGITCTRALKQIHPKLRIVLVSAYPDREFHSQGIQAGAMAFLDKKDIDMVTLRQVIDDVAAL